MGVRERIYEIIEKTKTGDVFGAFYEVLMFVTIIVSVVPLMFNEQPAFFHMLESITVTIFIIDYLLRWMTADLKLGKGAMSFVLYPFTFLAIIDLLSILPGINLLSSNFKLFRLPRLFRIFRMFKLLRYSSKALLFVAVLKKERYLLLSVLIVSVFYVFVTALIMYNIEPHINPQTGMVVFSSFFDALYWATVTLTTVGYGDLCPVTDLGRFVSMVSSLLGIAIIALPSGIITASYLDELRQARTIDEDGKSDLNSK